MPLLFNLKVSYMYKMFLKMHVNANFQQKNYIIYFYIFLEILRKNLANPRGGQLHNPSASVNQLLQIRNSKVYIYIFYDS